VADGYCKSSDYASVLLWSDISQLGACPSNQWRGHILRVLLFTTTTACGRNRRFCITQTRS